MIYGSPTHISTASAGNTSQDAPIPMSIPHIQDSRVVELLDFKSVVAMLDLAFADLARGDAAIHGRQRSECGGIKLSTMGALWPAQGVGGVKVYPTVAGKFSFAILLFDLRNNIPLAVLDGNELTRFRTAGITTLVASKVVRRDARKLALFGAGVQGRSQAHALCEVFDFAEIAVVDPSGDATWCQELHTATNANVYLTRGEAAVHEADIVVTATRSNTPVFNGGWLKPGAFVAAIGTSTPAGRELDDVTMLRAERVIVEWKPQSLAEAGEIALWEGQRDIEKIIDLPQLYRNEKPWRSERDAITVFKSVGLGLSDVVSAYLAFSKDQERSLLSDRNAST